VTGSGELTVVVAAPTGRDARLLCEMLARRRISCETFSSLPELCRKIETGVGAVVVAEEVLTQEAADQLSAAFAAQPKWSDIQLILLTSDVNRAQAAVRTALQEIATRSVVVLERPVRAITFSSTIASALNSRRRQYELRDYLEEYARQEERLRQTQKLESIGLLAGGIAHDFNNILAAILGNASLALDVAPPGSSLRPMLTTIVEASQRAARLTAQLLAYAGKGRFFVERLDLSEHVRQVSSLVHLSIPRTVELRLELATGLPCIEADAGQIQQLVMNLVINAAEAIPEGQVGTVLVVTRAHQVDDTYSQSAFADVPLTPGRCVGLEVRDSGTGMDEKTLGRIFDPFFTTKFVGRGLGLAAVLGIVRGHHGGIWVDSTPGQGTTFRILFPAAADRKRMPEKAATVGTSVTGTGTVLVIDDEELVRRTARVALEHYGYSVLEAEDGGRGVDLFRKRADEVVMVLLDMTMPVMSGAETFQHLRAVRPDVKVILSSGYDESETMRRFNIPGLAGFLQKPYTGVRLAEVIRSILAPPQLSPASRDEA
jgi:signal transduction histidine kinase/CheY-like chemotaxis protein